MRRPGVSDDFGALRLAPRFAAALGARLSVTFFAARFLVASFAAVRPKVVAMAGWETNVSARRPKELAS